MSNPIKVTPTLKGKDAVRFYEKMNSNKPDPSIIATIKKEAENFRILFKLTN